MRWALPEPTGLRAVAPLWTSAFSTDPLGERRLSYSHRSLPPTLGDQKRGVVGGSELVAMPIDMTTKTLTHPADRCRRLLFETQVLYTTIYPDRPAGPTRMMREI